MLYCFHLASSRICSRIALATRVAVRKPALFLVTSTGAWNGSLRLLVKFGIIVSSVKLLSMLRGTYFATVGKDGRVKMPSAWMESMRESGNRVFVTSQTGEFAQIYPMKSWNEIKRKMVRLSSSNKARRKFLMHTKYYGRAIELDGRGRIVMPRILREAAQLYGKVDLQGNLDHVEVWNHVRFVEILKNRPIMKIDERTLQDSGV